MKKRIVSALLVGLMLINIASCSQLPQNSGGRSNSKASFSHENLTEFLDKQNVERFDNRDDLYHNYVGYVSLEGKDAQDFYDSFRSGSKYSRYDITTATYAIFPSGDHNIIYLFTFEDRKEAKELYEQLSDDIKDPDDTGKKNGINYTLINGQNKKPKSAIVQGIYLEDDTVLIFITNRTSEDFADEFCAEFNIPSPY